MRIENITDEELMNMEVPPSFAEVETPTPTADETVDAEEPGDEGVDEPEEGEADEGEGKEPEAPVLSDDEVEGQEVPSKTEENTDPTPPAEGEPEKPAEPNAEKKEEPAAEEPKADTQTIDYAAEYNKLVGTPIKANGKEITLKDTNEVLRLVQQGANYAKRMEELKPARRSAAMLERAGLLGNDVALAHAIDLYNGKPEAIAKMAKDLKIDILSVDMESGDNYSPASHLQTDEEVTFTDTLREVRTLPGGNEAMLLIDSWDQASKDLVWGNAKAVREIYDYKQSGVYDTVATEVERRKTLGMIPEGTPFITAFVAIGEEMASQSALAAQSNANPTDVPSTVAAEPAKPAVRTPVATGAAPRKPAVNADPRAAAAASPRKGVGAAKATPDIYSLSDDDIMKMSSPTG